MTKATHEQTAQSDDSRDPMVADLNHEQAKLFLGVLANPPAASDALRDLMARNPPWETGTV